MPLSITATLTPEPAVACPPTWPQSVGAPICAGVAYMFSLYGMSGVTALTPVMCRTIAACFLVIFTARPLRTTW
jgi:hypothetical protein